MLKGVLAGLAASLAGFGVWCLLGTDLNVLLAHEAIARPAMVYLAAGAVFVLGILASIRTHT